MSSTPKILVINGPNLNMLGLRQPEVYGSESLSDVESRCQKKGTSLGLEVTCKQSNMEGDIVTWIQQARNDYDGILLNAGAYTHTSVAIHDAILSSETPVIEVHLSNIHAREEFRHHSFISPVAVGMICGFGTFGYDMAMDAIKAHLQK
ncbi:type II 3-dehydroquinate dehydratase [Curvivirga sp.]|uniref:type II 3-dehydroquinate dehydratase n=1 Tax=Curvivirga sp. TaxID=2856848 RepID=UPI003B5AA224